MCMHSSCLTPETCSVCKGVEKQKCPTCGISLDSGETHVHKRRNKENSGVSRTGSEATRLFRGLAMLGGDW